ncbi:MAG: G5 domain-containing protein [Candidatus Limnocylindria bacterium]
MFRHAIVDRERGEVAITEPGARTRVLRGARTLLLLCAAGGASIFAISSSGVRAAAGADGIRIGPAARASTVSRSRPLAAADVVRRVTIDIDGLPAPVDVRTGSTVAEALTRLGIVLGPADALSVPPETELAEGSSVVLDRGIPITLVDGGVAQPVRSPKGTLADLLSLYRVVLAPQDALDRPTDTPIAAGDVVRITRVVEREAVQVLPAPFAVQYRDDATVDEGTETVERPGAAGELVQTWLIRYVDGVEASRALVGTATAREAVDEVRVRGTRARAQASTPAASSPAAPGDIRGIIIAAAARWGANADQLLRVAYCESGYNPNAYNGILGASGLFQIIPGTWAANSVRAGYGGASVFDPVANANVAAYMFSVGQAGQWVCK